MTDTALASRGPAAALRADRKVSALIIAHDARATGGVNNFLRIMRLNIRQRIDATRFSNGRRHGEAGKLSALKRLVWDYVRFVVLLRRRRFDVLHVNPTLDLKSLPREMLFVWLCAIFSPRTKVLLFYRGWDWRALEVIKASGLKRALFIATHRHIDRVLLLSAPFKAALVEMGIPAGKIFTTTTMFEGEVLRQVLDRGTAKDPNQLLFMCRFIPAKGGVQTLEAFRTILGKHPQASLIMAGDGPQRAELEALAQSLGVSPKVEFTGYVGGVRKMTLLAQAGIFVLPTAHPEGMPNAVLEAMAAGEVVISTPIGGIPDVVAEGENGMILQKPDTGPLTDAIIRYLDDPDLAAQVRERNTAKAWANWESAIVSNRIADHYESLMGWP